MNHHHNYQEKEKGKEFFNNREYKNINKYKQINE